MDPALELQKEAAADPGVIPLAGGLPDSDLLPADGLATAFLRALREPDVALNYGWCEGLPDLRAWVAGRLRARGATLAPDDVVITAGAQQALALASAELLDGDAPRRVHVGALSYPAALDLFRLRGAAVVDDPSADVHYLMPGVANPTGRDGVPDPAAAIAAGRPLIVDEAYAELRFDGALPSPLLAAARDRVWHVGTVSKSICPGLRVGWLVPPPAALEAVLARKQATDLQAASLSQAVLARYLAGADHDAHLARVRAAYAERAERTVAALRHHAPSWRFAEPAGGFSLFVDTGIRGDDVAFLAVAIEHGVCVDPGHTFAAAPDDALRLRVSFSYAPADRLAEGVARLARAAHAFAGRPPADPRRQMQNMKIP
jgi:2-aminoadipate transaminase